MITREERLLGVFRGEKQSVPPPAIERFGNGVVKVDEYEGETILRKGKELKGGTVWYGLAARRVIKRKGLKLIVFKQE